MLKANNKVAIHISMMIDYCINNSIDIDSIILSEFYFILFTNLLNKGTDTQIIHKTNSSLLFSYKEREIKIILGKFIHDEQFKVDFTKVNTGENVYMFKDFYFKLK